MPHETIPESTLEFERIVPEQYQLYVYQLCAEFGIVPIYFARLIQAESNWYPFAVGKNSNGSEDQGIAQINSDYCVYFATMFGMVDFDPFNALDALKLASMIVSNYYKSTNSWYLAVCCYNAGYSRVLSGNIPESTKKYAFKIVQELDFLL
jgi:soluble lytic murein transglycosylase-like protein